jgi:hypothetical protein
MVGYGFRLTNPPYGASAYFSVIASPLKSALASTAPFWLVSTIARAADH